MIVLAFESSCDECAVALVENGKTVLSHVIFSQVDLHAPYHGVVPEIASRNHLLKILPVLEEALGDFPISQIDAVAASTGPGLVGALAIGSMTAQALAFAWNKPFIPVDHVEGHLYSPHLQHDIAFPYLCLMCSGGHTLLCWMESHQNYRVLGSTIDDAVGEAFDKVAKMLGLGYPGGPHIQACALQGSDSAFAFPTGLANKPGDLFNFSYSGLKTAVFYTLQKLSVPYPVADISASFQKAAVAGLVKKVKNAIEATKAQRLTVVGGVAANTLLRNELSTLGVSVFLTPLPLCGDNAAMIGGRAYVDFQNGSYKTKNTKSYARLPHISKGKRL
ncbi:MAG: tRNA (adenosine(37)-N6)-threonylcarbamoyltransferase complex transferase subunit TsaD [Brevinema sp.]